MRIRTTSSRLIATVAISGLGLVGEANAQAFSYNGDTGPGFWSQLSPDWEACSGAATNARQSPINISRVRIDKDLENLDTAIFPTTIDIFNNGHTIEQHYAATGSSITFEGTYYKLQQFHFHTLSAHSIDGAQGVMELHAVFQEPGGGDHLVIGMLFHVGARQNPFLQILIDAGLPEKNGDTIETEEQINLADAFTNTKSYYTYRGSLTTPPCSETVTWVVLSQSARMSRGQLEAFRRILGNNFRPTQSTNGRIVRASAAWAGNKND
jgi:carbonic anhydrase